MYFNQGNPLHKIVFENKEIIFSSKTKSFFHLLNKKQNTNLKKKIVETAKSVYLSGNDIYGSPFLTKIIPSDGKKGEL